MWEIVIICTLFGVFIFTSFIMGLHYGSKIKNNELIEIPKLNPVKIVKENIEERKETKQKETEQLIEETILWNIDNYDGSGLGQKDIPRKD